MPSLDPELSADPSGRWPALASDGETRAARVVVALATLLMAGVVSWEICAPILAGHYASSASLGIIADNMRTWNIVAPVWQYTAAEPDKSLYYCHHPWGIFWTTTGLSSVFGRSDLTCKLAPALLSVATPALLAGVARAMHRPLAGAVAALTFVALPITLSFAQFNALEVPVIAFGALFLWAWVRFRSTGQRRHLAGMLVGATLALHADWPAFVLVGAVLAIDLASFLGAASRIPRRRALGWGLLASAAALTGLYYLVQFSRAGALGDLLASYELRTGGGQLSLAELQRERAAWDRWMFTPLGLALGHAGAVVVLARAFWLRRAVELAPFAVLVMVVFQYVVFRQGAFIHVFWPHHGAMWLALAMGSVSATVAPPLAKIVARFAPRLRGRAHWVSLALLSAPLLLILRDGLEIAGWARRTGGRFDEKGLYIETDAAEIALLRALERELPREAVVGLHASLGPTWAHVWSLGGRVVDVEAPLPTGSPPEHDAVVADLRALRPREIELLLDRRALRLVGPYAVVYAGPQRLETLRFALREPTWVERWLGHAYEPVREIEPDPFGGYLVASHFGAHVAPPSPDVEPGTTEELAVAQAAALDRGDLAGADGYLARITPRLGTRTIAYDDGTRLLGAEVIGGVSPRLVLVFLAAGNMAAHTAIRARAVSVEGPRWSLVGQPLGAARDLGPKWLIPPSRWRAGRLYTGVVELLPRPGVEAVEVEITPAAVGPRPVDGGHWVEIFRD